MNKTMRTGVEGIKEEIARLSEKITRRIEEMENEIIDNPVINYQNDIVIHEAVRRISDLYRKGRKMCKNYLSVAGVCTEYKNEHRIFRELDLSETCARARTYLKKNCNGD